MKKLLFLNLLLMSTYTFAVDLILDGTTIPLDSNVPITIDASGNINITSDNGSLTCAAAPPTITNYVVSPATINSGESVDISWTLEGNATSCTKGGTGWSGTFTGSDVLNGNHSKTIANITTNSTFTLRCSNDFGNSNQVTGSVSVNGSGINCAATQPPILGGAADVTIKLISPTPAGNAPGTPGNPLTFNGKYEDVMQGTGWPGASGGNGFISLTRNMYAAMRFTTDNTNNFGSLTLAPPSNGQGPPSTGTTLSISECPGDFSVHNNQANCLKVGGSIPSLKWSQNPAASGGVYCKLDKGKTYYLNIVSSKSTATNFSSTDCSTSYCGLLWNQTGGSKK